MGFEENTVILGLQALDQLNMVVTNDGVFTIAGWEEYQNTDKLAEMREQTRQRVAKHREQKRLQSGNVTVTLPVTLRNAIEEDKEKELEKEFHSITHASATEKLELMGGELGQGVVFLSAEQQSDLLDKLSIDEFNKYVGIVAECERKGKRYKKKSHYQAILDMVKKDRAVLSPC